MCLIMGLNKKMKKFLESRLSNYTQEQLNELGTKLKNSTLTEQLDIINKILKEE